MIVKHILVIAFLIGGVIWNERRLKKVRFEIETEDALREAKRIINNKNKITGSEK